MAVEKHLEIIKKGVAAWNKWRKKNPEVRPNLFEADLSKMKLDEADFAKTDLRGANLSRVELKWGYFGSADLRDANLSKADFFKTEFIGANLRGANLERAKLQCANLSRADFREANLRDAVLNYAQFIEANLNGAEFSNAQIGHTLFGDTDLRQAIGLEKIRHLSLSTICLDTLKKSKGNISEVFLRQCGLSPWEIEIARLYDPSISRIDIEDILVTKVFHKRIPESSP